MTVRSLFIYLLLSYIKREIENPERINDGANAFDQHNLRQLFQDSDCNGRKCSVDNDCCWEEYSSTWCINDECRIGTAKGGE